MKKYILIIAVLFCTSASATGTLGEIRITDGFIHIATGTNTWKRVAISTW